MTTQTTPNKVLHIAAITSLLVAAFSASAFGADFSGKLKGVTITDAQGVNTPPVAIFTYTVNGNTVSFDASASSDSDGTISEYRWDFGDGTTAEGVISSHIFSNPSPTVYLTISDNNGGIAILSKTILAETFEMTIDNSDNTFTTTGTWGTSSSTLGYYGADYLYASSGQGEKISTWSTTIPSSGKYRLFCRHTAYSNRATNAPFTILQNSATIATVYINQKVSGGDFIPLGTFNLESGELKIILTNKADGYVIADAVKVVSDSQ